MIGGASGVSASEVIGLVPDDLLDRLAIETGVDYWERFEQSAELADSLAQSEERLKLLQRCQEQIAARASDTGFVDAAIEHELTVIAKRSKAVDADLLARKLLPHARVRAKMQSDRRAALQELIDSELPPMATPYVYDPNADVLEDVN